MIRKNRKRNRKEGFDYSQDNLYFITICVQNRICCFGSIPASHNVDLSPMQDPNPSPNPTRDLSVQETHLDKNNKDVINEKEEVRMNLNEYGEIAKNQMEWLEEHYSYVVIHCFVIMPNHVHVLLEIDKSLVSDKDIKIKSVSELIGAYKTTTSKSIRQKGLLSFAWQRSFHDHIIRNAVAYERIYTYIETNPLRWHADTFFAEP